MTAGSLYSPILSKRTFSPENIQTPNFISMPDLCSHSKHLQLPPPQTLKLPETCSVMTGNDVFVNGFVEQEESSIMDSHKEESSKWTNEKHSLYLKSIEASFIDQLYNSLDMKTCQTQSTYSSDAISTRKNHPNACTPSGQFKVLRHGCWSKKCFKTEKSHLKDAERPYISPGNPWIQHFTNGSLNKPSSTSLQYPVPESQMHQETACNNTEGTDQNFVEGTMCSRKKTKTSKISPSSNDQVVPYCTPDATNPG